MTGIGRALGIAFVVLGLFWTGRESGHGLTALWENWWCPLPLVAILIGVMAAFAERLNPGR